MRREAFELALESDLDESTMLQSIQSVAPEEFCELAVSSRPLVRWEDSALGLKGLHDRVTGEFFVVEAAELSTHNVTQA